MTRPPASVRTVARRNPLNPNILLTLENSPSASPTFQTTFSLFIKQPGVHPQKRTPGETPRRAIAERMFRKPFLEPIPMSYDRPTALHRNHSAMVAHQSLSMYIEPRPHLHLNAPGGSALVRLSPRPVVIGDNEWLQNCSTVRISISFCPTPKTPK